MSPGPSLINVTDSRIVSVLCVYADPPPVIVSADNVTAVPGDVAQLTCLVQSSVKFNVTWLPVTRAGHLTQVNGTAIIRSTKYVLVIILCMFTVLLRLL